MSPSGISAFSACARSSAWIERLPPEQKVVGSNPTGRTNSLRFIPLDYASVRVDTQLPPRPVSGPVWTHPADLDRARRAT